MSCLGLVAVLAFAAPAYADGDVSLSVNTNSAGAPTSTSVTAELSGGTESIAGVSRVMPTSLTFNLAALAYSELCPLEDLDGPDPLGDCPDSSLIGELSISTPLSAVPVSGSVILFNDGGSSPSIALVAINPSLSIDSRSYLGMSIQSFANAEVILMGWLVVR